MSTNAPMLKQVVCVPFAVALVACAASGQKLGGGAQEVSRPLTTDYTVTIADPKEAVVDVNLRIRGLVDDSPISLQMTQQYAFAQFDEPFIVGPTSPDGLVTERASPFNWVVQPGRRSELNLQWRVPLLHRDKLDPNKRDEYEHPYLAADHGMLVAATLFLVPDGATEPRVRFRLPEDWAIHSPWPEAAPGVFMPELAALTDDLIAIGKWTTELVDASGCKATIAFAPGQQKLQKVATPIIAQIVKKEIELFGMKPRDKYLFLFGRPDTPGFGGSPKHGSITLTADLSMPASEVVSHLAHLIGHEFHHTWAHPQAPLQEDLRFIGEGFADYYAYHISAQLGFSTWKEFHETLAQKLELFASKLGEVGLSLAEAGGPSFFNDPNAYELVYTGGFIIATLLDAAIQRKGQGKTLDDFMRSLMNRKVAPTLDHFYRLAEDYTDQDFAGRIRKLVAAPATFDALEEFKHIGIKLRAKEHSELGPLLGNLEGNRLVDLDPAGVAFSIGIRAGDTVERLNGTSPRTPTEVQRAWSAMSGRIQATVNRNGEPVNIDAPVPRRTVFEVSGLPLKRE